MEEAPFSVHAANTEYAALEGRFDLPDGRQVIWALSRREFGPMSFNNRPEWDVAYNRIQFLRLFGLEIDRVVSPVLNHTAKVLEVGQVDAGRGARNQQNALVELDGMVTRDRNLVLLTTHADCMPLWLCCPKSGWIGLAHVGWRGLLGGIVHNFIRSVPESDRKDLVLALGPVISAENYPVGREVAEKFLARDDLAEAVVEANGRYFLDLARGVSVQAGAEGAGIVTDTLACTFSNSYLGSFRRDGKDFSPMAAIIVRT